MLIHLASLVTLLFAASPPSPAFTVEARYIHGNSSKLVGKAVVLNGQTTKLTDNYQEPFVTAVEELDWIDRVLEVPPPYSANKAKIDVLTDGVNIDVKVTQRDLRTITNSKVFLDVTARVSEIDGAKIVTLDDHPATDTAGNTNGTKVQAPWETAREVRELTPIAIGKPITISIDDRTHEAVEITVRRHVGGWDFGFGSWGRLMGKAQSAKVDGIPYLKPQG